MLDIDVIERKVMDLFLSVAEHTRIELEQFINTSTDKSTGNPELNYNPAQFIRQQQNGS